MIDLSKTIEPKSDQLNADDLIGGPRIIKVTSVSLCGEPDQPIAIGFAGDNGKPYKPCKSMRRLLVEIWGKDGSQYAGRSLELYRDNTVKFGGAQVGGIRINRMSHLDRPAQVPLTVTRAVRKLYRVDPLQFDAGPSLDDVLSAIASAETTAALKATAPQAAKLATDADKATARQAYADRKAALDSPPDLELTPPDAVAEILAGIARHDDPADLDIWRDEAREQGLSEADMARVEAAIEARQA